MNKNKIVNYFASAVAGYVAWKVVDSAAPRKSQELPSIAHLALAVVVVVGLVYIDVALERKLDIIDD